MENIQSKIIGALIIATLALGYKLYTKSADEKLAKLSNKTIALETEAKAIEKKREELINGIKEEDQRKPKAVSISDQEIIKFWKERL